MTRPDPAYLVEITGVAEHWVRYCNDNPRGFLTSRASLHTVLRASDDVHLDEQGYISWRGAGPAATVKNTFTAEPYVPAQQTPQADVLLPRGYS